MSRREAVDPRVLHRGLRDNGYEELPSTGEHALFIGSLPELHKDPFDRILVAQNVLGDLQKPTKFDQRWNTGVGRGLGGA